MCEPVMIGLMVGSTILSATAAVSGGMAQSDALKQQGAMYDRQATIEAQNKGFAIQRTREKQDRVLAQQSAAFAEGGLGGGTVTAVMNDAVRESEMDVLAIARGADMRISNFSFQADQSRSNASQAKTAGYINGFTEVADGATSAYTTFG
ncbi:MAG: hypothetical protein JKY34_09270 [Kordiimonadaceae bacterium]|nr:hypothetical protein [Kordiimonadaceae bacterium]